MAVWLIGRGPALYLYLAPALVVALIRWWRRFRGGALTPARILAAVGRRVADLPHLLAWHISPKAKQNRDAFEHWVDRHRGQRLFILGNGPSLATMDLAPLAGEMTLGMNRIYFLFDQLPFALSYYLAVSDSILAQFDQEIADLSMPKFLNWNARRHFAGVQNSYFLRMRLGLDDHFVPDARSPISSGANTTYVALQLAYFMGFREVILLGIDHRFSSQATPSGTELSQGDDRDHFDPNYFPPGTLRQIPDLRRAELAFTAARRAFTAEGRRIIDATVGGELQVFPKTAFKDLF